MKRLFAVAILLSACSCSHTPVSSAQHDLDVIKAAYVADVARFSAYQHLPLCNVAPAPQCFTYDTRSKVITASYNASAALLTAESEQTNAAIAEARKQVAEFTAVTKELSVP